jgi:hypothetical protein
MQGEYIFIDRQLNDQDKMKGKPEERLLLMGERYRENQRRLQQIEQKRRKEEEDRSMVPEKCPSRKSSATRLALPVEQRMYLYLENCILRRQERVRESEREEFSLLKSPMINSRSRRIVANMTVMFLL